MEWIRFGLATLFLCGGFLFLIVSMFGVYRYNYVLNRMQAAAMGDTLGIALSLIGLIIVLGFSFASLKLILVIIFLWVASPVSSHLISRLEYTTKDEDEEDKWEERKYD